MTSLTEDQANPAILALAFIPKTNIDEKLGFYQTQYKQLGQSSLLKLVHYTSDSIYTVTLYYWTKLRNNIFPAEVLGFLKF